MPQTLEEFVRRGLAAQEAVDLELERAADPALGGHWIHFGPCGGVLTHLQGIAHPVCTRCGKDVVR
jgi:hypothetical protein